ncbi:hypothetical protein [Holdemanella biformis]|uniref:hypothetical protein n=1 Tax=Holdemanella biformis TaxID=1735 RepID=UPI0026663272|nr:hypothetical protein [Holdemanella biformis]
MNKIYKLLMVGIIGVSLFGCASVGTDVKSDSNGGLDRIINVYTADGKVLASYEGRIDIKSLTSGAVKFDYDGKRYIYYNCYVETIADK